MSASRGSETLRHREGVTFAKQGSRCGPHKVGKRNAAKLYQRLEGGAEAGAGERREAGGRREKAQPSGAGMQVVFSCGSVRDRNPPPPTDLSFPKQSHKLLGDVKEKLPASQA